MELLESSVRAGQRSDDSAALLLIDRLFEQRVNQLVNVEPQDRRHGDPIRSRQETPPGIHAAAPTAHVPQDWGEVDALVESFVRENADDEVVDLNSLPDDISVEQLQKLTGRVCRYRCLIHQPMNAEHYVGAVAAHSKEDGSCTWRTTKYRDWLPLVEEKEEQVLGRMELRATGHHWESKASEREASHDYLNTQKREIDENGKAAEQVEKCCEKSCDFDSAGQEKEGKTGVKNETLVGYSSGNKRENKEDSQSICDAPRHRCGRESTGGSVAYDSKQSEEAQKRDEKRGDEKRTEESPRREESGEDGTNPRMTLQASAGNEQQHAHREEFTKEPAGNASNFRSPAVDARHHACAAPRCYYMGKGELIQNDELYAEEEELEELFYLRRVEEPLQQLWTRWPYRCVAVPGETAWCRQQSAALRRPTRTSPAASRGKAASCDHVSSPTPAVGNNVSIAQTISSNAPTKKHEEQAAACLFRVEEGATAAGGAIPLVPPAKAHTLTAVMDAESHREGHLCDNVPEGTLMVESRVPTRSAMTKAGESSRKARGTFESLAHSKYSINSSSLTKAPISNPLQCAAVSNSNGSIIRGLPGCTVLLYVHPEGQRKEEPNSVSSDNETQNTQLPGNISSNCSTRLLLNDVVEVYGIFSATLVPKKYQTSRAAFAFPSSPSVPLDCGCISSSHPKATETAQVTASFKTEPILSCVCGERAIPIPAWKSTPQSAQGITFLPAAPSSSSATDGCCVQSLTSFFSVSGAGAPVDGRRNSVASTVASTAVRTSTFQRLSTQKCADVCLPASFSTERMATSPRASIAASSEETESSLSSIVSMWDLRLHAFYVTKVKNYNPALELLRKRTEEKAAAAQPQQDKEKTKRDTDISGGKRTSRTFFWKEEKTDRAETIVKEEKEEQRSAAGVNELPTEKQQHGLAGEEEKVSLPQQGIQQDDMGTTTATVLEKLEEEGPSSIHRQCECEEVQTDQEHDFMAAKTQQQEQKCAKHLQHLQQEEEEATYEKHAAEQQLRSGEESTRKGLQQQTEGNTEGCQQQKQHEQHDIEDADAKENCRQELLQFLTRATCGDTLAAEYVLLALCSRRILLPNEKDLLQATLRLNLVFPEIPQQRIMSNEEVNKLDKRKEKPSPNQNSKSHAATDGGLKIHSDVENQTHQGKGLTMNKQQGLLRKEIKGEQTTKEGPRPLRLNGGHITPHRRHGDTRAEGDCNSDERVKEQQQQSQEQLQQPSQQNSPQRRLKEKEKSNKTPCCCCCSLSDRSRRLLGALEPLVPRLRGFALVPEKTLLERRLTCRLLPPEDDARDEEGELSHGLLQVAADTVLLIEEPQRCTSSLLLQACRRQALQEKEEEVENADEHGDKGAGSGRQGKAAINCEANYSTGRPSIVKERRSADGENGSDKKDAQAEEPKGKRPEKQQEKKTQKADGESMHSRVAQLQNAAREELRALDMLFSDAVVPLNYGYAETRVPTNVCIICLSFNEPSLFADYTVVLPVSHARHINTIQGEASPLQYWKTGEATARVKAGKEGDEMLRWRRLIGHASGRNAGVCIEPCLRATIIEDWVRLRQSDSSIKSDDLPRWLMLADALAASYGEGVNGESILKMEHWKQVLELEARRRERVACAFS